MVRKGIVLERSYQVSAERLLSSNFVAHDGEAKIYSSFLVTEYCTVAARVVFLWDYLVTFPQELNHIWGRPCSGATLLFFLNRYGSLAITILELFEQASFQTSQSCVVTVRCLQSLLILQLFVIAVFSALRVYATWGRDWRPAIFVLPTALIACAGNLYIDIKSIPIVAELPSVGCEIDVDMTLDDYSNRTSSSCSDTIGGKTN